VTIVIIKRHGSIGLELVYQDAGGNLGSELLYSNSVANLEIVPAGLPWSFDADGALFRLTLEAYRIRLAYLFDPLIAVHTSLIEPLSHQITAVYETMLGKQPLRYLLADDPGAGKTIEGEYDVETRWAIAWFEQYAMNAGEYGIAETLSKAKNTSVQSLVDVGFLEAKAGKVRLLRREELAEGWSPKTSRLTAWEVMQRMIHALLNGNGEIGAGDILRQASSQGEGARDLADRL
jgi:hypothetical protein